jgi:tRNA(Arg) A34 adenosine deaminase TadA
MQTEEKFMKTAIELAKESALENDYALAAIVIKNGEVVGIGKTRLKHENDPTVHAEIVAIRDACQKLGSRFLNNCILYTTHEPCPMCAAAAIWARMQGIVFGATLQDALERQNLKNKFTWRQINISCEDVLSKGEPKLELIGGFMRKECNELFELSH